MTCRGANPRDCIADELKEEIERLRDIICRARDWVDYDGVADRILSEERIVRSTNSPEVSS